MLKEKVKFLKSRSHSVFLLTANHSCTTAFGHRFFFRTPTLTAHDSPVQLVLTQHFLHLVCLARPQGVLKGTAELKPLLILPCLAARLSPVSRERGQGIPTPGMSEVQAVHALQVTEQRIL